jgi:hypothetical protein
MGWHMSWSIVLGVFADKGSFDSHGDVHRLMLQSNSDRRPVDIASISKQAIPLFTRDDTDDDEWVFQGFFRVQSPTGQRVACGKVIGLPPELVKLKARLGTSNETHSRAET